ncbi:MAG: hypothetical protein FWD46_07485 [Cystobacterineae bacterium]|nr:hypothetical protein [Cystobacterineae bacterium]
MKYLSFPRPPLFSLFCLALPSLLACSQHAGNLSTLKPRIEKFHQAIRWKDFSAASKILQPQKQSLFLNARLQSNDIHDLSITDYELEEAEVSTDGKTAVCTSRLSWFHLPHINEQNALVRSHFVWENKNWYLERQENGPFQELAAP